MRLALVILLCASPWMAWASPYQAAEVTTAAQAQPDVKWLSQPTAEQGAAAYPERAIRRNWSGAATISCTIDVNGGLNQCSVMEEEPHNVGFGAAALSLSQFFKADPTPSSRNLTITITIQFSTPDFNKNKDECLGFKADHDASIKACTALIESNPEYLSVKAEAYVWRGVWERGKREEAIADFTEAITELTAQGERGIILMAYSRRANAYESMGLHPQAVSDFKKALVLASDHGGAEGSYNEAVAINPSNAEPYQRRAWFHYMEGKNAQALPDAERAVALAPDNGEIRELRAEIYQQLGRRDDAIADYRMALKLKPDSPLVKEELKRLGVAP